MDYNFRDSMKETLTKFNSALSELGETIEQKQPGIYPDLNEKKPTKWNTESSWEKTTPRIHDERPNIKKLIELYGKDVVIVPILNTVDTQIIMTICLLFFMLIMNIFISLFATEFNLVEYLFFNLRVFFYQFLIILLGYCSYMYWHEKVFKIFRWFYKFILFLVVAIVVLDSISIYLDSWNLITHFYKGIKVFKSTPNNI